MSAIFLNFSHFVLFYLRYPNIGRSLAKFTEILIVPIYAWPLCGHTVLCVLLFQGQGVSEVQFCTTEFEVASFETSRLWSKKVILEDATSNLQKWRGFAQSWCPFMPI